MAHETARRHQQQGRRIAVDDPGRQSTSDNDKLDLRRSDSGTTAADATISADALARALYRVLLLREPDPAGLAYYAARLVVKIRRTSPGQMAEGPAARAGARVLSVLIYPLGSERPIDEIILGLLHSDEFAAKFADFQRSYINHKRPKSIAPNLVDIYKIVEHLKQEGNPLAALTLCQVIIFLRPAHRAARLLMAQIYEDLRQPSFAIQKYEECLNFYPNDAETLFRAAMIHGNIGRHLTQVRYLRRLLGIRPQNRQAWFEMGHAHLLLRQFDLALECLVRVQPVKEAFWLSVWEDLRREQTRVRREALHLLRKRKKQSTIPDLVRAVKLLAELGRIRIGRTLLSRLRPLVDRVPVGRGGVHSQSQRFQRRGGYSHPRKCCKSIETAESHH